MICGAVWRAPLGGAGRHVAPFLLLSPCGAIFLSLPDEGWRVAVWVAVGAMEWRHVAPFGGAVWRHVARVAPFDRHVAPCGAIFAPCGAVLWRGVCCSCLAYLPMSDINPVNTYSITVLW